MSYMLKESYRGDPDITWDNEKGVKLSYKDSNATSFGFFPTSLDGDYNFFKAHEMHNIIAQEIADKYIIGKVGKRMSDDYRLYIGRRCYEKSYGIGRVWTLNDHDVISMWYMPSSKLMSEIVNKLGVDVKNTFLTIGVDEDIMFDMNEMTAEKFIESNFGGSDDEIKAKKTPWKIDKRYLELIRSVNEPRETWQSAKEKEGWKTMAQRNHTLYQEGKENISEYFEGDPDTLVWWDDKPIVDLKKQRKNYFYDSTEAISFGYFQTTFNGGKEFFSDEEMLITGHYEMAKRFAEEYVGKALVNKAVKDELSNVINAIYNTAAYSGRIFVRPRVITTWGRFSSNKLAEIIDLLGGLDKYGDFIYVVPKLKDSNYNDLDGYGAKNITVSEYINLGLTANAPKEEHLMKSSVEEYLENKGYRWLLDAIIKYNTPPSHLANRTKKLGNMTIAQYNSLIRQEQKEKKNTMNEKYNNELSNYMNIMKEALEKNDFLVYETAKGMLDESVDEMKHENALMRQLNTNNFGVLHEIFENELPSIFKKKDAKTIRKIVKVIKEDKNLLGQFKFYRSIMNDYNNAIGSKIKAADALKKLCEATMKAIDQNTVIASNKRFRKALLECGIKPSKFVDTNIVKLYEDCHKILTERETPSNAMSLMESYVHVSDYMEANKDNVSNKPKSIDEMVQDFEKKMKENLNESEISFVKQITDFKSPMAEQRKAKLFTKLKEDCLKKIDEMLDGDSNNTELKGLREQIQSQEFNNETVVKDVAKLLEIRDILMDD